MFSILISSQTFTELFDPCHRQLTNTLRHVFINIYQYCFLTHKTCDIRQKHVANTSRSFPHSRLITGFVTRLTRRVPLVEQELHTLPEHPNSPPIFSGVRVTRSLVLYVFFVDRFLYFFFWSLCCLFFFDIRILITSLWYLQTLPALIYVSYVSYFVTWYTVFDFS